MICRIRPVYCKYSISHNFSTGIVMLSKILNSLSSLTSQKNESNTPDITPDFEDLALYYRTTCPFCRFVMSFMKSNNIVLDMRNITTEQTHLDALVQQGGKRQVPCLRIRNEHGDKWLYESADITDYLEKRLSR